MSAGGIAALALGMELSWLSAWGVFTVSALLDRPFPVAEGAITLLAAFLVTRWSLGRGWLVLAVAALQAVGLAAAGALVLHGLYAPGDPLLAAEWARRLVRAGQSPQAWALLSLNLVWPIAFWGSGALTARRPMEYERLCQRLDAGLAAFFALFLVRLTAAVNGGAVEDPVSARYLYPFIASSLTAIGAVRARGEGTTGFLSGYRSLGILLSFAAAAVLGAVIVTLFAWPYLTQAAAVGLTALTGAARFASPPFLWLLRRLFAPQTLRPGSGPPSSPGTLDLPALDGHHGWWADAIEKALGWGMVAVATLAALMLATGLIVLAIRLLLSRTAGTPKAASRTGRGRFEALRALLALLLGRLQPFDLAAHFYGGLLRWAGHSGVVRAAPETPLEFGERLRRRFPTLRAAIATIVQAYNEETYRCAGPTPGADVRMAWRELRRPRHWRARLAGRWRGDAESGNGSPA